MALLCALVGLSLITPSLSAAPATTASSRPASTQPANDFERVAETTLAIINRITEALTPVKDEATAKAALPKIEALQKEVVQLKEAAAKLGQPSEEVQKAMQAKYAQPTVAAYLKCAAEQKRVREDLALEPILGKPLDALGLFQSAQVPQ